MESMSKETFASRLKMLREEKKVTLDDVATYAGTTKATIHKYENAQREPKLSIVKAITNYFGCDFDWLVGFTDERYPEISLSKISEVFNALSDHGQKELCKYANYLLQAEMGNRTGE